MLRELTLIIKDQVAGTPWMLKDDTSMQLLNKVAALAAELKVKAQADGKDDSEPERILSMIGSYDGMKGKYVIILSILIKYHISNY